VRKLFYYLKGKIKRTTGFIFFRKKGERKEKRTEGFVT